MKKIKDNLFMEVCQAKVQETLYPSGRLDAYGSNSNPIFDGNTASSVTGSIDY